MNTKIKEKIIQFISDPDYIPLSKQQLLKRLDLGSDRGSEANEVLDHLEEEGKIYKTKKDKYGLPEKMGLIIGRLSINPRGFGFVEREGVKGIFISANAMNFAMHTDMVVARKLEKRKDQEKDEAEIIKILHRGTKEIVGIYEDGKNRGFVIPQNKSYVQDIYVPRDQKLSAKDGDLVVCKITHYPTRKRNPEGEITKILGNHDDPNIDLISIMEQFHIPTHFPEKVLRQANKIPSSIEQSIKDGRLDLRKELTFTIDGSDAKDFDDAISISRGTDGIYHLGVHIADVSQYVQEKTPIDEEAFERGTSVYLVDVVSPMLPEKLSNGVCSLLPNEDRLTLSCLMDIDSNGKVLSYQIKETVIRSSYRLVYDDVSDFLEQDSYSQVLAPVEESWILASELAEILFNRRKQRGAIEFGFPESKIEMKEGVVVNVSAYQRRIANTMIEEFMLIANETVAEDFNKKEIPFVYRIHEKPDEERLQQFASFISTFGIHLKGNKSGIDSKELQSIVEEIKGKPIESVVSMLTLRSLKRARYSPLCLGHFGLATLYYCHFTSPIRRYPDLQIHRIIKDCIHQKMNNNRIKHLTAVVEETSKQSSQRERIADEAERQVDDLRKAQYMKGFIGMEFKGQITGVANFGMFITLPNTVEGVVKLNSMHDDYYILDAENFRYIGEHTHKIYAIGDKVRIRVESVHEGNRSVQFILV